MGLMFGSAPPVPAPATNPWLVAVDGSDNALRAVAHAAGQAGTMKARVLHLVNLQPWLVLEAAEAQLAQRAWLATARPGALLDANSQPLAAACRAGRSHRANHCADRTDRLERHRHRQPRAGRDREPAVGLGERQAHAPESASGNGGALTTPSSADAIPRFFQPRKAEANLPGTQAVALPQCGAEAIVSHHPGPPNGGQTVMMAMAGTAAEPTM